MINTLGLESANGMSGRKDFSLFGTWAYAELVQVVRLAAARDRFVTTSTNEHSSPPL